jgi:hypothetical protein
MDDLRMASPLSPPARGGAAAIAIAAADDVAELRSLAAEMGLPDDSGSGSDSDSAAAATGRRTIRRRRGGPALAAAVAALAAIGGLAALAARSGGSGSGPSGTGSSGGSSSGSSVPVPAGRNVFGLPAHTATATPVGREAADVDEEVYAQMWLAEEAEDAEWWMQELEKEKMEASNKVPPVPVPVVVNVQRPPGESFQAIPPPLAPETQEYQGPNNPTAPPTEVGGGGMDDAASSWSDLVWGRPLADPESLAALAAAAAAAAEAAAATSPPATEDVPPPPAAPRPEPPQSEEEETLLSLLEEIGMAATATEENSQAPPKPAAPFVEDEEEGTTTELPPPVDEVELDSVWVDPPTVAKEQGEQQQQQPAEVTCSGRCSDEFLAGCVAYECAQGSSSYDAWDACRLEIDIGLGPLATRAGCLPGCADTGAMALARECGCSDCRTVPPPRPVPVAGSGPVVVVTTAPAPTAAVSILRPAPCSGRCSDEFLSGCVAYQCATGSSSFDAWDTCRDEIDTGTGPLVTKVGCAVGCTDTAAMALSKVGACGNGQGGGILRPPPTAGPATTTTTTNPPFRPPPPNAAVQNTPPPPAGSAFPQIQSTTGKNGKLDAEVGSLGLCQGDCDDDQDCGPNLKCFWRSAFEDVPGCTGRGKEGWDYCIPLSYYLP